MKDSIRRIVMLCTILTLGLILVFFDVTLIQLLLMLVLLVIILPFLLGSITVAEVRAGLVTMKKSGIIKRLDEMKFFEKAPKKGEQKTSPTPVKAPAKPEPPKAAGPKISFKDRISARVKSLSTTFGSLGAVLKVRSKPKKVEEINKMLDKTVSEKVPEAPPRAVTAAAGGSGGSLPTPGGAGTGNEADPFLSLSDAEFDDGLLDGLGDDAGEPAMPEAITPDAPAAPEPTLPVPELSMPSLENAAEPGTPSPDTGGNLDEFAGLEGSGSMDEEFGDLDNVSLDDVELDDEGETAAAPVPAADTASPTTVAPSATPGSAGTASAASGAVQTAWIPSDAPKIGEQEDQIGVQSDMASFAGGATGSDEDLLSSIASDVKTVKKEKDVSLLRELKDFKAPAADIENELKDMYQMMGSAPKKARESNKPAQESKK